MAGSETWQAFYYASWQWPWALLVAPFAYLMFRAATLPPRGGAVPEQARFLSSYLLVFAVLTMADPIVTGPVAKWIGSEAASTGLGLLFVLLGDFRVLWLVLRVAQPAEAASRTVALAAGLTAAVPISAYACKALLDAALGEVPGQVLWLSHETLFVALALYLARRFVPSRLGEGGSRSQFLRAVLGYVAAYYGLWASADVLILLGVDEGWAVRAVPNQLYYAFFVPFVHLRFFASSASQAAQASR